MDDPSTAGPDRAATLPGNLVFRKSLPASDRFARAPAQRQPEQAPRPNYRASSGSVRMLGRDKVFKDTDSVPLGTSFRDFIRSIVGRCRVVLIFIGPNWLAPRREQQPRIFDEIC